jgi:hypothetical protein
VKLQRPKVEPIRQPTLFPIEKVKEANELASELKIERPYSLPGILLGLEPSIVSAIPSILVTLFQFLPVPGVFSVFSNPAHGSFERPMPLGK